MKVCSRCGVEKPYNEFSKWKKSNDGLQYNCKECAKIKMNQWAKDNPIKKQQHNTKWRRNNPEKNKQLLRKWRTSKGIGVYGLWNKIENCWDYIGEGQLMNREISHKSALNTSTPMEVRLNIWFDGFDNVYEFRVLCKCDTKEQCKDMETKYIHELNPKYVKNKTKRQHKVK